MSYASRSKIVAGMLLVAGLATASSAQAQGFGLSVNVGGYYPPNYTQAPVFVAPAPVVVARPAPIVVARPAPIIVPRPYYGPPRPYYGPGYGYGRGYYGGYRGGYIGGPRGGGYRPPYRY